MKEAFRDLLNFEAACGHPVDLQTPDIPSPNVQRLRMKLIREEHDEMIAAMHDQDLAGIADGAADSIYVILGTCVRYGIDINAVWDAVHAANMTKVGPLSARDENGKIIKPPGFKHPDIAFILANQKPLKEIYGAAAREKSMAPPETLAITEIHNRLAAIESKLANAKLVTHIPSGQIYFEDEK